VAGVQPIIRAEDPYVGFAPQLPVFVPRDVDGTPQMVTADNKQRWFNPQQFAASKPEGVYRIVALGGSTTYGRPYDDATSFSGWLRELLHELAPEKTWEVINAGGISYASYRVVHVMEEMKQYQPDLFLVYTGHNEFLEERTYRHVKQLPTLVRTLGGWLAHLRTYSAMHRLVHSRSRAKPHESAAGGSRSELVELEPEVRTRLDQGVGPDAYSRDSVLAEQVNEHFRYNLHRMAAVARDCDASLILITPASNLADCTPFKSEHGKDFSALQSWQSFYDEAEQAWQAGELDRALTASRRAVALAPQHAHTLYLHGRILCDKNQTDDGRAVLEKARDEDVCPLRATSDILASVHFVAQQEDVPVIDFAQMIQARSRKQITGSDWFLDHVHPTVDGHRVLAEAIAAEIAKQHQYAMPANSEELAAKVKMRIEGRIDVRRHGEALKNLAKVLSWAGKQADADRLALQAAELLGGDAETEYLAGNALLAAGDVDAAIKRFDAALQLDPMHHLTMNSLGSAYHQRGDLETAQQFYLQAAKAAPQFAPVHNNLGALYQRQGKLERANTHYREAVRLNPRYAKAFNNLGALARDQSQWSAAEAYFRKALEIDGQFAEALVNWGDTMFHRSDLPAAQEQYVAALRVDPRYAAAHHRRGVVLQQQGRWREAAESFGRAIKCPSPPLDAAQRLAWIIACGPDDSLRSPPIALQLARNCVRASSQQDAESLSVLAAAYAAGGQFSEAIDWQTRALSLAPDSDRPVHQHRLETLRSHRPLAMPTQFPPPWR
jgi:tetratricopeptide (TPR) repeat protein